MIPENTNIITSEDTLPIRELVDVFTTKSETMITSYNTKTCKTEEALVVSTRRSNTHDLMFIETDYDEVKLLVTHDQRVYVKNKKQFLRPDKIHAGDQLLHVDDIEINVIKIHKIKNTLSGQVYTLVVDKNQNFFANDILIHNND
jgi:intein/homing endonuclease